MTSDNGTTFTSRLWKDIQAHLNTIVSYTPVYSPASLGSLERQHADIKNGLRAILHNMADEYQSEWMSILPWVILSRRTALHGELRATPAQAVMGSDQNCPEIWYLNGHRRNHRGPPRKGQGECRQTTHTNRPTQTITSLFSKNRSKLHPHLHETSQAYTFGKPVRRPLSHPKKTGKVLSGNTGGGSQLKADWVHKAIF